MHRLLLVARSAIHLLFLVSHLNLLGLLHRYHQAEVLHHLQAVQVEAVVFHLQ